MTVKSYKNLEIYWISFDLAMELHQLSLKFPKFEVYEEGSQLRRSSKGVAACIAEGWGRRYYKNELSRFLVYARASCDETKVHLDFALGCNYMTKEQHRDYVSRYDVLGKKINNYLKYVTRSYLSPKDKMSRMSVEPAKLAADITEDV